MAYSEEARTVICSKCGSLNHVIVAYSGYGPANERETAECFQCGAEVDREECFAIYAGSTAEAALSKLRRMQNRAKY